MKLEVVHFQLKPLPRQFSVERLFEDMRSRVLWLVWYWWPLKRNGYVTVISQFSSDALQGWARYPADRIFRDSSSELRAKAAWYCDFRLIHEDLRINLPGYIRFLFDNERMALTPLNRHIRKAHPVELYTDRYEDLLGRGKDTFTGVVEHLSGQPADPARISSNGRGDHLRELIAGKWLSSFDLCVPI